MAAPPDKTDGAQIIKTRLMGSARSAAEFFNQLEKNISGNSMLYSPCFLCTVLRSHADFIMGFELGLEKPDPQGRLTNSLVSNCHPAPLWARLRVRMIVPNGGRLSASGQGMGLPKRVALSFAFKGGRQHPFHRPVMQDEMMLTRFMTNVATRESPDQGNEDNIDERHTRKVVKDHIGNCSLGKNFNADTRACSKAACCVHCRSAGGN